MMTTPERVVAIASHLAGSDLSLFIEDAYEDVINVYGVPDEHAERPNRYLAAHLATLNTRRVLSEKVSDMQIQYQAESVVNKDLESSPYGQEFLRLIARWYRGDQPQLGLVVL